MEITKDTKLSFNEKYLTADGRPWFPVMGEIHYSRVRKEDWERELLKMKAGGVDIVSAYTIWIHHEEERGVFDFTGCRDLRAFVQTLNKCGLKMFLRIGPWAHGEVRNGGFPDWLMDLEREGKLRTRTNDPAYMDLVRIFYERIFREVEGLFIKDGGPIIGVQIENEYGHCGGLTGEEGEKHMKALLAMARETGFDAPLYTATGWGGAVTGGMLPVMGGYCEAPWDQRLTEIEPSGNYIFTEERNDHAIGSDHGIGQGITFDMHAFPYLTAELGGGLQVTRHRRPVASGRDTEAMSLVKLGSGCNLLGYYMYHGGTNPEGKFSTLQESRDTGYPNDLPVLSYDFNAPVREYGQLTDAYRRIRRLSMFIKDFGEDLCGMDYIPQEGNPGKPEDQRSLRRAVRASDRGGYLFVSDYQRRRRMQDHPDTPLRAFDREGKLLADFGREDVRDGDIFFYPFDMPLSDGNLLKTVNAVPLCILRGMREDIYVFYAREGRDPRDIIYQIEAGVPGRRSARALTLTEKEALQSVKVFLGGRERLVISEDDIVEEADGSLTMICRVREERKPSFRVCPALDRAPAGFETVSLSEDGSFGEYRALEALVNPVRASFTEESPADAGKDLKASLHLYGISGEKGPAEALLVLSYEGESAELTQKGESLRSDRRASDSFYTGQDWEIGLARFAMDGRADFELAVHPIFPDTEVFLEKWPSMKDGCACRVNGCHTEAVFELPLG